MGPPSESRNKENTAARTIQKAVRGYLQKKAAFMHTMGYNKAMRSLVGNFPRQEGRNALYKRSAVFRKLLFEALRPIKSRRMMLYRGLSGHNAEKFRKRMGEGKKNFTTHSFTSFSQSMYKAKNFASKGNILVLRPYGGLPVINYTNKRRNLRTMYPSESEVLLPPGKFKVTDTKTDRSFTFHIVEFTPSNKLPNIKNETLPRVPAKNDGIIRIGEMNKYWTNNKTVLNAPGIKNKPMILQNFLNQIPKTHPIFKRKPKLLELRSNY